MQPGGLAGLGHAGDDVGHEVGVEHAGGDVVEEEQRRGRLHEHVVDAVVDDVGADAADRAEPGGQLDLGADAVGRGDEHGVVHRRQRLGRERAAEAADAAHDLGAVRALDGGPHLGDGAVALVDVDAGGGVRRERGAGRPPADVAADLHPLEVDAAHRLVGGGAGGGQVGAEPGDGEHPPAGRAARRRARPGTAARRGRHAGARVPVTGSAGDAASPG